MPKKVNLKKEQLATNKVYEVIAQLSKLDRRRLQKFLESPYFNQSDTHLKLYQLFAKNAEEHGSEGFNKHEVWRAVFQNSDFNDVNFRKYCSDLFKLVQRFLAQISFDDEPHNQLFYLADTVRSKKIEPLYKSSISEFKSFLQNDPYLNSKNYYYKYKEAYLEYEIFEKEKLYKSKVNFEEISDNLDKFYLFEKLKLLCSVYAHKRLINVNYEILLPEEFEKFIEKNNLDDNQGLSLFYHTFLLMKHSDDVVIYEKLKENLLQNWHFLSQQELSEVIVVAMNFCTNRINKGDKDFYREYFVLIQFGIEKNVFVTNNLMEVWRFNNFVYAAIQLDETKWAENFIQQNQYLLPADQRESTVSFNLARIYRKSGQYEKVIEILRNVEYADLSYNINSKAILISVYYDLDEYDTLDSFIESFKVYLNRHKDISTQKRKLYLNYLKYTRRLMNVMQSDKKAIEKIKNDLRVEKSTTVNFDWLMEKIAEME